MNKLLLFFSKKMASMEEIQSKRREELITAESMSLSQDRINQKLYIRKKKLDETLFNNLFLLHISLEKSRRNGESLPERVSSIRTLLDNEPSALSSFNAKLVKAGYFNEEEGLYLTNKYKTRDCRFYRIEKDFPRIKEKELREGVGEITYKIVLSACTDYRIPETEVLRTIQEND